MQTFLVVVFLVGVGGIAVGAILGWIGWARSWVFTAVGSLLVRLGALIVFVWIAVDGFRRGGWFLALGFLFSLISLVGLAVYVAWGAAVFGGDRGRSWVRHSGVLVAVMRLLSSNRRTSD